VAVVVRAHGGGRRHGGEGQDHDSQSRAGQKSQQMPHAPWIGSDHPGLQPMRREMDG
jgi:hypothetical protein